MKRREYKRCLNPIAIVVIKIKGHNGRIIYKKTLFMIKDLPYKESTNLYDSCIGRKKTPIRLTLSIYNDIISNQ